MNYRDDPYQWHDAFALMHKFDDWADDLEDKHQIEMRAVSRSAYEGAMEIRSRYEQLLNKLLDAQSAAEFQRAPPPTPPFSP